MWHPEAKCGWQAGAALLCHVNSPSHSLQIPALTGNCLFHSLLLSSRNGHRAEQQTESCWQSSTFFVMQLMEMFLLQRVMLAKIYCSGFKWHIGLCVYSSVSCWLCLWLSAQYCVTEVWLPEPFILRSSTHNNHVHRKSCRFPEEWENLPVAVDSCLQS